MKRIVTALGAVAVTLSLTGCGKVPAGYVGIKVDLYGSNKGVQQHQVGVGRYWVGFNEELYVFPVYNQLHNYEEPFSFQTSDSMTVKAKIGVEYAIEQDKASLVFQTYRKGVDDITDNNLRQNISNALIKYGTRMNIDQLAAGGKITLLQQATDDLRKELGPIGIRIVRLNLIDDLDYPTEVKAAINAKIKATQQAQLRENEVAQSQAEAQKEVAKAQGDAQSIMLRAKAEADAIELRGNALRSNPEVLSLEAINKWNGVLPQYMTSNTPVPFVPVK
ncbi:SPFH domain-containing protein [Klebsiella pneumoniae]|nr:SPFH domain-containing protein [Klebsiella pneumoniae]